MWYEFCFLIGYFSLLWLSVRGGTGFLSSVVSVVSLFASTLLPDALHISGSNHNYQLPLVHFLLLPPGFHYHKRNVSQLDLVVVNLWMLWKIQQVSCKLLVLWELNSKLRLCRNILFLAKSIFWGGPLSRHHRWCNIQHPYLSSDCSCLAGVWSRADLLLTGFSKGWRELSKCICISCLISDATEPFLAGSGCRVYLLHEQ